MGECPSCLGRGEYWMQAPGLPRSPEPTQCGDCFGTGQVPTQAPDTEAIERAANVIEEMVEGGSRNYTVIARAVLQSCPDLSRMREALQVCANKFWEYVIIHEGKKTPDGDEKAARNREMAEMCEQALATHSKDGR